MLVCWVVCIFEIISTQQVAENVRVWLTWSPMQIPDMDILIKFMADGLVPNRHWVINSYKADSSDSTIMSHLTQHTQCIIYKNHARWDREVGNPLVSVLIDRFGISFSKRRYCHFDKIFITGCTDSCQITTFGAGSDQSFVKIMMTSSNGNIFRVTGHLCREFTGPGEFPAQRPVTRSFDVFFDLRLNKRLIKQSWGWRFETLSRPLWRHCNDCNDDNISVAVC